MSPYLASPLSKQPRIFQCTAVVPHSHLFRHPSAICFFQPSAYLPRRSSGCLLLPAFRLSATAVLPAARFFHSSCYLPQPACLSHIYAGFLTKSLEFYRPGEAVKYSLAGCPFLQSLRPGVEAFIVRRAPQHCVVQEIDV